MDAAVHRVCEHVLARVLEGELSQRKRGPRLRSGAEKEDLQRRQRFRSIRLEQGGGRSRQ